MEELIRKACERNSSLNADVLWNSSRVAVRLAERGDGDAPFKGLLFIVGDPSHILERGNCAEWLLRELKGTIQDVCNDIEDVTRGLKIVCKEDLAVVISGSTGQLVCGVFFVEDLSGAPDGLLGRLGWTASSTQSFVIKVSTDCCGSRRAPPNNSILEVFAGSNAHESLKFKDVVGEDASTSGVDRYRYAVDHYDMGPLASYNTRELPTRDLDVMPPLQVLIVTTATAELEAVCRRLDPLSPLSYVATSAIGPHPVFVGMLGGRACCVCQTQQGAVDTAVTVVDILGSADLKSIRLVFVVGFAWGADPAHADAPAEKQMIGDVLLAKRCYDLSHQAVKAGDLELRGTYEESALAHTMNDIILGGWPANKDGWGTVPGRVRLPKVHAGSIVSHATLYDDSHEATRWRYHNQTQPHNVLGGEMELYQVVSACRVRGKKWLLAKAICDWGGIKARSGNGHPLAAAAAVDFAAYLLQQPAMNAYLGAPPQTGHELLEIMTVPPRLELHRPRSSQLQTSRDPTHSPWNSAAGTRDSPGCWCTAAILIALVVVCALLVGGHRRSDVLPAFSSALLPPVAVLALFAFFALYRWLGDSKRAALLVAFIVVAFFAVGSTDPGPVHHEPRPQNASALLPTDPGPVHHEPRPQNASALLPTDPGPAHRKPRLYHVKQIWSYNFVERPELERWRDSFLGSVRSQNRAVSGIVAAQGIAGVAGLGKTTAMAWLMHQPPVWAAFPDGIFWLQFSQDRKPLERLQELASWLPSVKLEERDDEPKVLNKLQTALEGKKCFIGLDDVWHREQVTPFIELVGDGIRLMITTRQRTITEEFCGPMVLRLEYMTDEQATELLRRTCDGQELQASAEELNELLKKCSGLPAMLQSVGATICRNSGNVTRTLSDLNELKLEHRFSTTLVAKAYDYDPYGYLFTALAVQLDHLPRNLQRCCKMLAVFAEDAYIPLGELQGFWDRRSMVAVKEVVELLAREHLVQRDEARQAISLIDAVRDFLHCQADEAVQSSWHMKLLSSTLVERIPEENGYWTAKHFSYHGMGCGDAATFHTPLLTDLQVYRANVWALLRIMRVRITGANASLNSLQELHLGRYQIGDEGMIAFSKALSNAPLNSLEKLDLSFNAFGDEGMLAFSKALSNAPLNSLQQLDLRMNGIGDAGMTAFASALSNAPLNSLQVLDVSINSICDEGMLAFSKALSNASLNSLQELNLWHNQIGDAGMIAFSEALSNAPLKSLKKLSLPLKKPLSILTCTLDSYETSWSLGEMGLNDADMLVISAFLSNAPLNNLTFLDLHGNEIGDEGMTAFASALSNAPLNSLQVLDLSGDVFHRGKRGNIGDEGMIAFAKALSNASLNSLQFLDLSENQISDAGMTAFASALSNAPLNSLTRLELGRNQIGDAGMTAFANALSNASLNSLRSVYLRGNEASRLSQAGVREWCMQKRVSLDI